MRAIFCRQCGIASLYPHWKMRRLGWRKRRRDGWFCPLCIEKKKGR